MSWSALKPQLARLHRWTALILAPVFLLILLSAAVLALEPLADGLAPARGITGPTDAAALVRLLDRVDPSGRADVSVSADGRTAVVGKRGQPAVAWDIASGQRGALPPTGTDVFGIARQLHRTLFIGAGVVVEAAAYAMTALVLVGPLLAWPRLNRTALGWHLGLGWGALPLVVGLPLTAVLMTLHLGAPRPPQGPAPSVARAIEQVAQRTDASGLRSARVWRGTAVRVELRSAGGAVTWQVGAQGAGPMRPTDYLVRSLHVGNWGGAASGALNFVGAVALLGLTGTGLWSWWARRRLSGGPAPDASAGWIVAHASQTGTAAALAQATAARLRAGGSPAQAASVAVLDPARLDRTPQARPLLLIVSTAGDGQLPDPAQGFVRRLSPGSLTGLRFAMLGLGDSRHARFCAGAETLRQALIDAGATEVLPLARADAAPQAAWQQWLADLQALLGTAGLRLGDAPAPAGDEAVELTLAERRQLNDPTDADTAEAWQLVWHSSRPLDFRAGDLLLLSPGPGQAPRAYSIGSSAQMDPRRIELTVGLASWRDEQGQEHLGAMSGPLCRTLPVGAAVHGALRRHPGFNLPDDPARPVIMLATGCGIAPFTGFLAEVQARGATTPTWLIFGNRRQGGDFFHRERLHAWLASGVLGRLDTVFSRDGGSHRHVQDLLREHGAELAHWLIERDAVLYVCGRASTLGRTLDPALQELLQRHAGLSAQDAQARLQDWAASGKLRRDLFG